MQRGIFAHCLGEAAGVAMGTICSCEMDVAPVTLSEMKRRMEGNKRRVQSKPDIYVTIDELILHDDGSMKFSPIKFTLSGLKVHCTVEVEGTASEMASLLARKGTEAAMTKVGCSQEAKDQVKDMQHAVEGKVGGAISSAKNAIFSLKHHVAEKVGVEHSASSSGTGSSFPIKKFKIDVVVNMVKEFDTEEVRVVLKDFHAELKVLQAVMSIERVKDIIEREISFKATQVATQMAKKKKAEAIDKASGALSAMGLSAPGGSPTPTAAPVTAS